MTTSSYVISAAPEWPLRVKNFMGSGDESVARLLQNQPTLRYAGFDLNMNSIAEFVNGEYWEIRQHDRKALRLYQDGQAFLRVSHDYLGHARQNFGFERWVNPNVAVELHYSFVLFYALLAARFSQQVPSVEFTLKYVETKRGEEGPILTDPPPNRQFFASDLKRYLLQESNATRKVSVGIADLTERTTEAAFHVVKAFYSMFDVEEDKIPHTRAISRGKWEVDLNSIKALGGA